MKAVTNEIQGNCRVWEVYGKKKLYISLEGGDIRSRFSELCWDLDSHEFTACKNNLRNDESMSLARWEEVRAAVMEAFGVEMGLVQKQIEEVQISKSESELIEFIKSHKIQNLRRHADVASFKVEEVIQMKGLSVDMFSWPGNMNELNRQFRKEEIRCILSKEWKGNQEGWYPLLITDEGDLQYWIHLL